MSHRYVLKTNFIEQKQTLQGREVIVVPSSTIENYGRGCGSLLVLCKDEFSIS